MKESFITLLVLAMVVMIGLPVVMAGQAEDLLKAGILGGGTGAIAAGASGGKAGKGALIGMGTGIVGDTLFKALSGDKPHQEKQQAMDIHQEGYSDGFADGYKKGYQDGWSAAHTK
jgi:hypothetical protein